MTPVLVLLAVLVAAAGALAVTARDPRLAALGTLVALVGSAYVADPLPGSLALAARLAGTVLAAYLVWIVLRRAPAPLPASELGLPGAAAVAIVAFVAGWLAAVTLGAALGAAAGTEGPQAGGVAAALAGGSAVARAGVGAAFALAVLGIPTVLLARDVLRLGLGLLLLVAAAGLVRNALAARAGAPVELAVAVLVALAGAGVAALVAASVRASGDLALRSGTGRETAVRHRPADEAHRRVAREE